MVGEGFEFLLHLLDLDGEDYRHLLVDLLTVLGGEGAQTLELGMGLYFFFIAIIFVVYIEQ
jgi:hypothetical protein